MRILPFPTRNARKFAQPVADWSQQEIADFYRAHRLLGENGAAIGIDRGVSDIGEPWLVFFDLASQDVFLHVARIDGRCYLICDPLNLRLSAANITALITEFESSVRAYLSIRSGQAKNVVIHPAARIIMSISAIFLLLKLENSEAYAKGLSDKAFPDKAAADAGIAGRLSEKTGTAFLRAQNAFSRAFDAVDAPANAAALAGVILAAELALSVDAKTTSLSVEAEKPAMLSQHAEEPILQSLGFDLHKMMAQQTETSVHIRAFEQAAAPAELSSRDRLEDSKAIGLLAPQQVEMAVSAALDHKETATQPTNPADVILVSEPMARSAEAPPAADSTSTPSSGLKSLTGALPVSDSKAEGGTAAPPKQEAKPQIAVSLDTLDSLVSKVGFASKTSFDDVKSYAFKEYLTQKMGGQFTFEYQSGKLLIEQAGSDALPTSALGIWTNVAPDHSTMTVVGKAALIDDVLNYFG
ncbi:hypothetical protein HW571_26370 [Agrobacterium genomosp. 3]|uniref:hypothetical protein n=1 Tax=Agrobacterium tomkonis TaxID=1183410 RepID=UPI001CD8DB6C|nr:hypothetical protein [Agrobacterium tomkonis]MCA1879512.1 hypothetical protein [Agrobacterium tumefaciens]MCA1894730.1 hypothetical protein [Agrobacterium tomkonis]